MKEKEIQESMRKILQADFAGTVFEPLLQLTDCPKHMYVVGELPDPNLRVVTVVGSRAHTTYAKQALEYVVAGLAGQPVCVVSGLALGIDAQAHRLALRHGLPTVVVPGSGLGEAVLYPASNRGLAQEVLGAGGCLMSEFEPNERAARWTFPKRNRIMAALADVVLVVEAGEKSGTLITARNALEYNKEVGVVPGSIFNEQAIGSNDLLRHGAHAIVSTQDMLELLQLDVTLQAVKTYDDVNEQEMNVLNSLTEPKTRDELQQELDMAAADFMVLLSLLEIKGYVKEELGLVRKV